MGKKRRRISNANRNVLCKECSTLVPLRELERHHLFVHSDQPPPVNKPKKNRRKAFQSVPVNPDMANELRIANQETIVKNEEISTYIESNPIKTKAGNLGKPQDPFRWGYYGSTSAEYDFIRNSKK